MIEPHAAKPATRAARRILVVVTCLLAASCGSGKKPTTSATKAKHSETNQPVEEPLEVALGEYRLKCYQPVSDTNVQFQMSLYATVTPENKAAIDAYLQNCGNRLRDLVLTAIRDAHPEELEEPDLARWRRKTLFKLNGALGEPLLQTLYVSEFWYKND